MDIKSKVNSFFYRLAIHIVFGSVPNQLSPLSSVLPPHPNSPNRQQRSQTGQTNYFLCPLMESGVFPFPSNWCLRRIDGTYRQSQLSWD